MNQKRGGLAIGVFPQYVLTALVFALVSFGLMFYVFGMFFYILPCLVLAIAIIFIQILHAIKNIGREPVNNRPWLITYCAVSTLIPLVLIANVFNIYYAISYIDVYLNESHYIQQIKSKKNHQPFLYQKFYFGRMSEGSMWLIYDESDQVALDYLKRSAEWFTVSGEISEAESCSGQAIKLRPHFYLRYVNCK